MTYIPHSYLVSNDLLVSRSQTLAGKGLPTRDYHIMDDDNILNENKIVLTLLFRTAAFQVAVSSGDGSGNSFPLTARPRRPE